MFFKVAGVELLQKFYFGFKFRNFLIQVVFYYYLIFELGFSNIDFFGNFQWISLLIKAVAECLGDWRVEISDTKVQKLESFK